MFAAVLRGFFLWLAAGAGSAASRSHRHFCDGGRCASWPAPRSTRQSTAVRGLNAASAMATIDVLGESVDDRAAADRAAAAYVTTIERIAAEQLDANVSLKLTQMGLGLGVEACVEVLRPIVEAGRRHRIFVRIDMEASATPSHARGDRAACTREGTTSAWCCRPTCIDRAAMRGASRSDGIRVRICKGAYAEPAEIAWHDRRRIGQSFVDLA